MSQVLTSFVLCEEILLTVGREVCDAFIVKAPFYCDSVRELKHLDKVRTEIWDEPWLGLIVVYQDHLKHRLDRTHPLVCTGRWWWPPVLLLSAPPPLAHAWLLAGRCHLPVLKRKFTGLFLFYVTTFYPNLQNRYKEWYFTSELHTLLLK